jgi:hypothetical protein
VETPELRRCLPQIGHILQAALMVLRARELGTLRLWPVDKSVGTVRNHIRIFCCRPKTCFYQDPILSGPLLQGPAERQ